jgi:cyclomaltodextrinase
MLEPCVFHPRDPRCKTPFGAVASGGQAVFTLRPLRSDGYVSAALTARLEQERDRRLEIMLPWCGLDGSCDLFSGVLETGEYVGLIWYSLRLIRMDGTWEETGEYQLTVYDPSESVPSWFGEGVTYQIFPDRFCRSRIPESAGMPGGRWVHQSWDEEPAFGPDEHGEVRNRDFFGGDLKGVMEKLSYLHNLGVETLYFCPLFESPENHRYGTGDYEKIDPMLGTNEDFSALCAAAHKLGMRIMLDGVFNHTAFVSKYFNGEHSYPTLGASESRGSPYYDWFLWDHWPDKYASWWGIYSMPTTNKNNPEWLEYITGENGIIRSWLRAGADGWRLDVADELPDSVVAAIHAAARAEKRDCVVIGEVWEDGSNKMAYSVRRRHIWGDHCDGLMNYPFQNAVLSYLLGGDARDFMETMECQRENYPPFAFYSSMNAMGTHDTARILTRLGAGPGWEQRTKVERASYRMSPPRRERAKALLKLGAAILFAFPGSPTVYYGDEAGLEGFEDPFNRRTFPWGQEDRELTEYFSRLGKLRKKSKALRRGDISYIAAEGPVLAFTRSVEGEMVLCAVNAGEEEKNLCWMGKTLSLPPLSAQIL